MDYTYFRKILTTVCDISIHSMNVPPWAPVDRQYKRQQNNNILRFGDRIGHRYHVKAQVVSVAHKLEVSSPIMPN